LNTPFSLRGRLARRQKGDYTKFTWHLLSTGTDTVREQFYLLGPHNATEVWRVASSKSGVRNLK